MENASVQQIELLTDSAQNLINKALSATSVEGEWSPTILLGHLSDVDEQVWQFRIGLMITAYRAGEDAPSLESWEPDESETIEKHKGATVQEVAARFLSTRENIVQELRGLADSDWQASARHATFGRITIFDLVKVALAHDVEHSKALKG